MSTLAKRAVLMRLCIGLPGEFRQDKEFTGEVQQEHKLGTKAGKWVKSLYPPDALESVKKTDNAARAYHNAITLPFDQGIGILPAALIVEYTERMRKFRGERQALVESTFIAKYDEFIAWARLNHNGTFDASLYPPVDEIRQKFYFRTEPLPVPDSNHFETSVKDLIGLDADSVNVRIEDATKEGQRELLKRMIEPVKQMADVLAKEKPRIFDTMVEHLVEIAQLAPKMNLTDDPQINAFAKEIAALGAVQTNTLRNHPSQRNLKAQQAQALMRRLSGYNI